MHSELLYNFFSDDDFLRISNKIKEMEKITAGEKENIFSQKIKQHANLPKKSFII